MSIFPIIIYLNKELEKQVRILQKEISDLTGSTASLDLWKPHITVGSAVQVEDSGLEDFYDDLKEIAHDSELFSIQLDSFDFMEDWSGAKEGIDSPYVVYLKIAHSQQLEDLALLIKECITLERRCTYSMPWPYKPHLMLAFKDLDEDGFKKAKNLLQDRSFKANIQVDHIAIAQQLEGGKCVLFRKWEF